MPHSVTIIRESLLSPEEKISTWLARIIAADKWKPTANSGISSSAIDIMDMCTQLLELGLFPHNTNPQKSLSPPPPLKSSCSSSPSSPSSPFSPSSSSSSVSIRELVKQADPETREKASEFVLRYCRLVSQSMCEGLICRDIENAQEHMVVNNRGGRGDGGEERRTSRRKGWRKRRKKRGHGVRMTVPGPLPPECCVKCNDVEHIAYWAAGNGLCAEEDQGLLMDCLRESRAFLSSWCAVYPCHAVRRALRWRAAMRLVPGLGDYLDTQLCALVGDLNPRIFAGVVARVWDDIMSETARHTRAWNKRRARRIVVMAFEYFYAGGEGLSAQTLESSSGFQRLKEYLHL